jgi:hypothetical protein
MTDNLPLATKGTFGTLFRGPKKAEPETAGLSTDPTLDIELIPPAAQLRLSAIHPSRKRTDFERDAQQNARYQKESRERQGHKRESSITGMVVAAPISIVHLQLTDFESKQVIEASSKASLAKHGYDPKRILTPREDRNFIARLAEELLKDLFRNRLKGRK